MHDRASRHLNRGPPSAVLRSKAQSARDVSPHLDSFLTCDGVLTSVWQIAGRVIASLVQWTGGWGDWGARKGKRVVARQR